MRGKRTGNPTKPRQSGPKSKKNGGAGPSEPVAEQKPAESAPPAPQAATESPPPMGHNTGSAGELTAEQRILLEYQHMRELIVAQTQAQAANGYLRATRKRIKAEGSVLSKIDKMVRAQSEEGCLALFAESQETAIVLAMESHRFQVQTEMFNEGDITSIERARHDARRAYRKNEAPTGGHWPPGTVEHQAWLDTYNDLMAARVREGIQPIVAGGPTPLEATVEATYKPEQLLLGDAGISAAEVAEAIGEGFSEALEGALGPEADDALAQATQAVTGEPISEAGLLAGLDPAEATDSGIPDFLNRRAHAAEMMPPEPETPF